MLVFFIPFLSYCIFIMYSVDAMEVNVIHYIGYFIITIVIIHYFYKQSCHFDKWWEKEIIKQKHYL